MNSTVKSASEKKIVMELLPDLVLVDRIHSL